MVILKTDCLMDLVTFPHDHQVCRFRLGSFTYDSRFVSFQLPADLVLRLLSQPMGYHVTIAPQSPDESLLQFYGVNYSYAGFTVDISRRLSSYVFNYYMPTGSFVVISWVNFLIPTTGKMLIGRLMILVTLFLVLINIFLSAKSINPATATANRPTYLEVQLFIPPHGVNRHSKIISWPFHSVNHRAGSLLITGIILSPKLL